MKAVCLSLFIPVLLTISWACYGQESNREQREAKHPLELPDVIVYGVDTGLRESGEKLSSPLPSPPAILSALASLYPSYLLPRGERLMPSPPSSFPDQTTVLSTDAGLYSSWGLQAVHNGTLKQANLRLFANLQGTNGQFDNSGGTWGEIGGKISGPLSNSATGGLRVGYRRRSYGLYGSTVPLGKSRQEIFSIRSHLERKHSEQTLSRFSLAFQRLKFFPTYYLDRYENLFQGDLSVRTKFGPLYIRSNVDWTGDRSSMERTFSIEDAHILTRGFPSSDLLSLSCVARIPLLPQFSADLGGVAQLYSREGHDDQTRLFPRARLLFRPIAPVAVYTSVGGSFRYYSLAELLKKNPYADPCTSSTVEEIRWQVETGVEVEVRPELFLRGSHRWAQSLDDLYWRWSEFTGTYTNFRIEDLRQQQIDISASYQPYTDIRIEAGFSFLDYVIKDRLITGMDPSPEIPFRPRNQAWGIVAYNIPGVFDVRSDWKWVGKRTSFLPLPFDSLKDTLELDPYFLINFTLERKVHRATTLFANIYNLTDSDYEVWYNYPEMGITVHGGVKIVF